MSGDHADFYVGTGPDARWLGSLADLGHPAVIAACPPGAAVLAAVTAGSYEAQVGALLAEHRAGQVGFVAMLGPDGTGWPWLAATSGGWHSYTFLDGKVRVSSWGGPWFLPDPDLSDCGIESATGPVAELPVVGDTAPRKVTFTVGGYRFRGTPIPVTTFLPPVSPEYLARRDEPAFAVAAAVEQVLGRRWPLPDLAGPAIREATHTLLRPGPRSGFHELPQDAPFAYERLVAALGLLADADRYAEGNNPTHAAELLHSAASVAAQAVTAHRTGQPHP